MSKVRPDFESRRRGALPAVWRTCRVGLLALLLIPALTAAAQSTANTGRYLVQPRDVLRVDVSGRADITGQYTVDVDGAITLPNVGRIPASGRTTDEIATDIARRLSLISREVPLVNVSLVESSAAKYFVLGAVLLPGAYNFPQPPTVWEAIAKAGGASDDANLAAVEIISPSQIGPTVVDVAGAIRGSTLSSLPHLRPGDTVRVPRTNEAQASAAGIVYIFGAVSTQT
jgi:polysaccharide export outer membrane protein